MKKQLSNTVLMLVILLIITISYVSIKPASAAPGRPLPTPTPTTQPAQAPSPTFDSGLPCGTVVSMRARTPCQCSHLDDMPGDQYCCGWYYDSECHNQPLNRINNPVKGPDNETFNALNPLYIGGSENIASIEASNQATTLSTPGGIVSRVIKFLFPLAGLVLFVMLVWGGFEIMMGSISKKVDAGKQRVTAAIVGFFILFAAYWIWQIIQVVFGVKIL